MPEDIFKFETAMHLGQDAHIEGNYAKALQYRFEAFYAPAFPIDRGRAARDIAASFDRLGNDNLEDSRPVNNSTLSEAYAEYAYREHKMLKDSGDEQGAREFTVSAMYAAIVASRQKRGDEAVIYIKDALSTSEELYKENGKFHQYDVNLIGRAVGILAMFGDAKRYHWLAKNRVTQLAKISETEQILGRNPRLNSEQIRQSQRKALIRGYAARSIATLQSLPTRKATTKVSSTLLYRVVL